MLLRTCIVYCEESLTQDLHALIPELCDALRAADDDSDSDNRQVRAILRECCELLGSFIAPENFVPFLLPRVAGDLQVVPTGVDAHDRSLVLRVGSGLMRGARPAELVPHAAALVDALTSKRVTAALFLACALAVLWHRF